MIRHLAPPSPMKAPLPTRLRRRRGVSTLEFVLVFPLVLMIFFASIEFAWMFYIRHQVSGAAREGVRTAIVVDATASDVSDAVDGAFDNNGLSGVTHSHSLMSGGTAVGSLSSVPAGDPVTVIVTVPWSQFSLFNVGFAGFWTSDISGGATMRREG